jgi:diaminopimelate decarboxylase
VESPHELALLDQAARAAGRRANVLFRVNLPGPFGPEEQAALVMGGKPSPFGMDGSLLRRCAGSLTPAVRLRGLHAHLASGVGADGLLAAAGRLVSFGRQWCAAHGVTEPEFNLGGGMAVDYTRPDAVFDWPGYGRGLAGLARPGETLRIEPGRAVTAYCGWYLTRVLDVKHSHGEAFAVVAGGTHHLRTPAAKGHDQPFAVIEVEDWAPPWPRPGVTGQAVTIAGQLCTPKDVLARRVRVSRLRAGDLMAFGLAGAYAWNISHHGFGMHPPPSFHYLA